MTKTDHQSFIFNFFKLSFLIYVFSYSGSFLNYLFHYLSGSKLSLVNLGEFEALFSIYSIIGIIIGSINYSLLDYFSKDKLTLVPKSLIQTFFRYSILTGIILIFLYYPISSLLKINNFFSYFLLALSIIINVNAIIYSSFLQSKYQIFALSVIGLVSSFTRTTIFFFTLNPYVSLVISTIIAYIVNVIFVYLLTKKYHQLYMVREFRPSLSSISAIVSTLCLNLFMTIDLLMTRFYFNADTSGIYASATIIGKVILFATTPILTISVPMIIENIHNNKKSRHVFLLSILFTVIIGATILSIFTFKFEDITRLLFNSQNFFHTSTIITYYSIQIFLYVIFNIIIQTLICYKKVSSAILPLAVIILQFCLIVISHNNVYDIIRASTISISFGLLFATVNVIKVMFWESNKLNQTST